MNNIKYAVQVKFKLEAILQKKKISKYRFAQLMGVPASNVFRYFKSDYDPKLSTLERCPVCQHDLRHLA